jgi:hypothetical protein
MYPWVPVRGPTPVRPFGMLDGGVLQTAAARAICCPRTPDVHALRQRQSSAGASACGRDEAHSDTKAEADRSPQGVSAQAQARTRGLQGKSETALRHCRDQAQIPNRARSPGSALTGETGAAVVTPSTCWIKRSVAGLACTGLILIPSLFLAAPALAGSPWWRLYAGARPTHLYPGAAKSEVQRLTVSATGGEFSLFDTAHFAFKTFKFNATGEEIQGWLEGIYGANRTSSRSRAKWPTGRFRCFWRSQV